MPGMFRTVAARLVPRTLATLALIATLLNLALAPATPSYAGAAPGAPSREATMLQGGEPAARVQVIINSVTIANDRDGALRGAGDFTLNASFWRCSGGPDPCAAPGGPPAERLAVIQHKFSGDSGDTRNLGLMLPADPDSPGFSLIAGHTYKFQLSMFERDTVGGDYMGGVQRTLQQSDSWAIGPYLQQPAAPFADKSLPTGDIICAGCGDIIIGDYLVSYEVRMTPLADLRPREIRVVGAAPASTSGEEQVCLVVENVGQQDAGPFNLNLYTDNTLVRNGSVPVAGLHAGGTHESCISTLLPQYDRHTLRLVVDQFRAVDEMNEQNNHLDQELARMPAPPTPPPASPGPTSSPVPDDSGPADNDNASTGDSDTGQQPLPLPSPAPKTTSSQGKSDVKLSTLKVRGQVPDGKDDCKPSKSDVSVVVRNVGSAKTDDLPVRLLVDGEETAVKSVDGLGAGREREVRFEDVRLDKGKHTLQVMAGQHESMRVEVRCDDAK